jgi:hypothetical protein
MKTINTIKELKNTSKNFRDEIEQILNETGYYEDNTKNEQTFEEFLGGKFCIIENYEDLKNIPTLEGNYDYTRNLNITETSSVFDICEWNENKNIVILFNATNNSGGNTYLVPKEFVIDNIINSME